MILKSNGYKELNLDLSKGTTMEKTYFQLGEDEIPLSSKISAGRSLGEVSRSHRMTRRLTLLLPHCRFVLAFNIFTFWTIGRYGTASQNYLAKHRCSFHRLFDPLPSGLRVLEQRVESVPLAIRQVCLA
ncbi:hypothetical protein H5410_003564 [Solanum commersonii]|uniref:Uncharacterized protein n=1 Tax=Solanum commersonii TaxID=4109 RepID=A0A9J6B5Z8_SOLCO|nr:hypothetical protein H5410_003564 [Solanum commersonii]